MSQPKMSPLPSAEKLWEMFDYNPLTGALIRKQARIPQATGGKGKYITISVDSVPYRAHRLIYKWVTGCDPELVEHLDDNGRNNCFWNLRSSSLGSNAHSRAINAGNACGCFLQKGRWYARTYVDGLRISLGSFLTKQEAYEAYCSYHTAN